MRGDRVSGCCPEPIPWTGRSTVQQDVRSATVISERTREARPCLGRRVDSAARRTLARLPPCGRPGVRQRPRPPAPAWSAMPLPRGRCRPRGRASATEPIPSNRGERPAGAARPAPPFVVTSRSASPPRWLRVMPATSERWSSAPGAAPRRTAPTQGTDQIRVEIHAKGHAL